MDANGNKVHALRNKFENYDRADPPSGSGGRGSSIGNSFLYKEPTTGVSTGRTLDHPPHSTTLGNPHRNSEGSKEQGSSLYRGGLSLPEDPRRNGIYMSNSMIFHPDAASAAASISTSSSASSSLSKKRRPLALDLQLCDRTENPISIDLDNSSSSSSSLTLGQGHGQGSCTSSGSSTCINLLPNEPSSSSVGGVSAGEDGEESKDPEESQAHTPTSSSSASSSGYGKVKRSNAFRAKDVLTTNAPIGTGAPDESGEGGRSESPIGVSDAVKNPPVQPSSSAEPRKCKMVIERVKSLDSASSNLGGGPSGNTLNTENTGSNPAQRAQSVCVRPITSPSTLPTVGSNRNNGVLYERGYPSSQNNQPRQLSLPMGAKAVNVVTPYQVSDIYSQLRTRGSSPERKALEEVQYAVPIIRSQRLVHTSSPGPPKVPPPPKNYPPSTANNNKGQLGLPQLSSFLPRQKSGGQGGGTSAGSSAPNSEYGGEKIAIKIGRGGSTGTGGSGGSGSSTPSTKSLPPDKPPRTFLYDILTDRKSQGGVALKKDSGRLNPHDLYGETRQSHSAITTPSPSSTKPGQSNPNNPSGKRQCSSSSSSSTLTSLTTSYKAPGSLRGSSNIATATVRQTNKTNYLLKSPSLGNRSNKTTLNNYVQELKGQFQGQPLFSHPPLVRSKTESQLIVKTNKQGVGGWGRFSENSHNPKRQNNNNSKEGTYDYGYKVGGDDLLGLQNQNLYAIVPPPHFLPPPSANNLLNNNPPPQKYGQKEGLDGRTAGTNTNLLKYNNRYPSNPGIYQSSMWKDHGLPPVIHNSNSSANLRISRVAPQQHSQHSYLQNLVKPHPHSKERSSPLLYTTREIDLEEVGSLRKTGLLSSMREKEGLLWGAPLSSSNHRWSSEDRLCERSKSEWALNQWAVHGDGGGRATPPPSSTGSTNSASLVSVGGRRNTVAGSSTGHPSLDSNLSTSQYILSTPPTISGGSVKIGKRTTIPNSIQNLVNQLFSTSGMDGGGGGATSSTDSGIQLGVESYSSSETPVGDSTTDTGDSDCENEGETSHSARQVVEARKGYVRRVSSIRVQELGASINRLIQNSVTTAPLFESLLVVGLNRDPYTGLYHPYIRDKFPPNAKLPGGVEQFCFPDSYEWPCHEGLSAQFYTLAITDQRGSRKYGCCYRILPEGANICIPITYCIISSHRATGFYREVLREMTVRHGYSEYQKRFWMEELYKKPFPATGSSISVTEPGGEELYQSAPHIQDVYNSFGPPKTVSIKRRVDHRLDEGDLVTLLTTVDLPIVIKIFGSLLLERKVVLMSRALNTLSMCVEALESMLYPFSWQHTFVPILPLNMTDVLDAPAPFLIGLLKSSQSPWDKTLDEGIVVDLDQNKVISCVGDEGTILPKRIHRKIRDALQLVLNLVDQKESTKNVLVSECFIRMFVETMGHHAHHIVVQQDGLRIFERESFVKGAESKAVQNFLEWFSETSMFHEFIQLRLKNTYQSGLFEQRIMEQYEQSLSHPNPGTPLSFKNAKLFMNKTRPFGNWLKEAFVK